MRKCFTLFAMTVLTLSTAWAGKPFANLDSYKSTLGFTRFYSQNPTSGRALKVLIIDSDFGGYEAELGKTLPALTKYMGATKPLPKPDIRGAHNGTKVAQLFTAMMTDDLRATQWMPELTLYHVSNFSGLQSAVDYILTEKIDLVLNSQVWHSTGNFDGQGFINQQVQRATQAGVVWISLAGDFAKTTFNSSVRVQRDDWVSLPDQNNALMLRCEQNKSGKCLVEIALAWNDFKNDLNAGTNKDLDLVLTDDLLNILKTSTDKQTADPGPAQPGYSKLPQESISAELTPGLYFIRIKDRSHNFTGRDQLRITVDGTHLTMPSHTPGESLLNPADNPTVITVGANDNEESSGSLSMGKPDLLVPSKLVLENGIINSGSDNSAAIVAAGLGLLKSQNLNLSRQELLKRVRSPEGNWDQGGLSLQLLGFRPTGPGCFWDVALNPVPGYLHEIISKGGVPVETTAAVRVMVPFDPVIVAPYLRRQVLNDMIVALPQGGYAVYPRYANIPPGAAEIFQRPLEAGLCRPRPGSSGKNFHL